MQKYVLQVLATLLRDFLRLLVFLVFFVTLLPNQYKYPKVQFFCWISSLHTKCGNSTLNCPVPWEGYGASHNICLERCILLLFTRLVTFLLKYDVVYPTWCYVGPKSLNYIFHDFTPSLGQNYFMSIHICTFFYNLFTIHNISLLLWILQNPYIFHINVF